MKIVSSILFLTFSVFSALAQDEPYYKDMANRQREDLKFLPNLETTKTRLYVSSLLAFRFQNSTITSPSSSRYESINVNNLDYGGSLGLNFNDNWYYDLGVSVNPLFMQTTINIVASSQRAITISRGMNFTAYSFTLRKRIWQIDKVTKNAAFMLTGGLSISPRLGNTIHEDRILRFGINGVNGSVQDTATYRVTTRSDMLRVIPQLGFEISGKIVEQVEIGFYSKFSLQPQGTLFNDISFRINSDPNRVSRQDIGSVGLDFGVILRWNMINWVNYKSKVE